MIMITVHAHGKLKKKNQEKRRQEKKIRATLVVKSRDAITTQTQVGKRGTLDGETITHFKSTQRNIKITFKIKSSEPKSYLFVSSSPCLTGCCVL